MLNRLRNFLPGLLLLGSPYGRAARVDFAIHLQGSGQCGAYTELQPFLTSLQSAANSRVHFEVAERNSILGSVAVRAKQLDDWLDAAEHRSQLMSRIRR
ncbi:hypothetical protein HDF11_004366 [Tunturiibacter psychrotolerans]